MSALARQQQALLAALFDWPPEDAINNIADYVDMTSTRGIKAYQTNGHAVAERALQAAYPVLAQLVGLESFHALARDFWHTQPPLCGDVAQWGAGLPGFVAHNPQLGDAPYLADVASVEWAMHLASSAPDAQVDMASFSLLTQVDPAQLFLRLAPGSWVHTSAWPVASVLTAHIDHNPSFAEVGERLRAGVAESVVVWRSGLQVCLRLAQTGEVGWINALLAGQSLGQALDDAVALDLNAWLPMAVQTGLLLGATTDKPSDTKEEPI